MYSLILMATVAGTGDFTSFHKRSASCHGCSGAPIVVAQSPLIYNVGCYGAASPVGCWGCSGCTGCTGCSGIVSYPASCFGSSCFGCCGGCCGGCYGGGIIWSVPVVEVPMPPAYNESQPITPPAAEKAEEKPASITIELPEDARLVVDGTIVEGKGGNRTFSTPSLPTDRPYYYDMTAQIDMDGKTIEQQLRVVVRGGENLKQTFGELLARLRARSTAEVAKK